MLSDQFFATLSKNAKRELDATVPPPGFFDDFAAEYEMSVEPTTHPGVARAQSAPRIEWLSADKVFAPQSEPEWVVPDLQLGPGRPNCIAAYAGLGKTVSAQALTISASSGRPIWDWFKVPGGPKRVRYVDLDQGRGTLRRFDRLRRGMGIPADELRGTLQVALFPRLNLVTSPDDLWDEVCSGQDLVVIDALRGLVPGIDENDSRIQESLLRAAAISDKHSCTFLLLHHFGKGGSTGRTNDLERLRGSSGIAAGLGSTFTMTGEPGRPRLVAHVKQHPDATSPKPLDDFALALETVPDDSCPDRPGWKLIVKDRRVLDDDDTSPTERIQAMAAQVSSLLGREPGLSTCALRARVRGDNRLVPVALENLERQGAVRAEAHKGRGRGVDWHLVERVHG